MSRRLPSAGILASFAIIYLFWGATFLAIKIGDRSLPPEVLAALRFLAAGAILYAWGWARGWPHPRLHEWRAVAVVAVFMFPIGYGIQFWAETRVPSGVTAVIVALVPLWVAALEIWGFGSEQASAKVLGGCLLGIAGMGVLMAGGSARAHLPLWPVLALVVAAFAWSLGTVLIPRLAMPRSPGMSAAAQMLVGGAMLAGLAAGAGEWRKLHWAALVTPAAFWSLAYLVLLGSVVAYGVFVWLLTRVAAVQVATYALVNPVVALFLGWGWGGEALTAASLAGSVIILGALALVLARPSPPQVSVATMTHQE